MASDLLRRSGELGNRAAPASGTDRFRQAYRELVHAMVATRRKGQERRSSKAEGRKINILLIG